MKGYMNKISNFEILCDCLKEIQSIPYFVLPQEKSARWVLVMRTLFTNLGITFLKGKVKRIPEIQKIQNIISEDRINEWRLVQAIRNLFLKIQFDPGDELSSLLASIETRSKPLWEHEEYAFRMRMERERTDVMAHDKVFLEHEMQLYALDYFLSMHKWFSISDVSEQRKLVIEGKDSLPSLKDDALGEDMLKKIVYEIWDWRLKVSMVKDFYEYKETFLGITQDVDKVQLGEINIALREYCKKLLNLLLKNGITHITSGFLLPYGYGDIHDITLKYIVWKEN